MTKGSEKKLNKRSMLLLFLKGSKRYFAGSILSAGIVAAMDMIIPQIIRIVVDYCLEGGPGSLARPIQDALARMGGPSFVRSHLWLAAVMILAVAGIGAVFRYLNTYWNIKGTEGMVKTARDCLYEHIESLPFSWHQQNKTGDIIQRCTSDMQTVREFVSEQLIQVIRIVLLIVFSMACMASLSMNLSMIVFFSVPIIIAYSYLFYRKIGYMFLQCDENEGVLSTVTQENLTGIRVVRAFGREAYERERFRKQNHLYTDTWMKLCRILAVYWGTGDFITEGQTLLIVVFGAILCVRGNLTPGEFIAFISYNRQMIWPVRRLGRMLSDMSKAGVSMDRLLYILNSEPERWKGTARPEMKGDITFRHVSFSYTEGEEVLKDISFTMKSGSTVGILGTTGSGKSTLTYLMTGLYPLTQGEILYDGIPLQDISLPWLREHIGIVLQEPFLFSRTLAENIAIASEADATAIRQAADTAALDESVMSFSRGYDTLVGERGVTLSGGQKQRAAIARMLVQKTPIMVFDDSLSAVDARTDEKIRRALKEVEKDATVLMISHRISTLMDADQILVMDQGRIIQRGTHAELMAVPGLYRHIYEIQKPEGGEAV